MRTLVIGVGNTNRGDDAAGLEVVRRLREKIFEDITVIEETGEATALMEAWRGWEAVLLIDAVLTGTAPGTLCRIDANAGPIPASFFHYSTHSFGLAESIELARALGELPAHLIVLGIEGKNFAMGSGLSLEVERAIEQAVAWVLREASVRAADFV